MTDNKNEENEIDLELLPDEEGVAPDLQKKIKKLKEELKKCGDDRKQYLDGWQRAKADYINYKNDEGKRFEDMARFVVSGFIADILPVLDSFDLALSHKIPPEIEKGVLLIRSQFMDILKKRGLEEIEVRAGEAFNPEKHEGIGELGSDYLEGSVAEMVQRGYDFRGKIIRPARVRISKGQNIL